MRKTTLLPTLRVFMLLLAALVAGGGKALAEDGKISFGTAKGSVKIDATSVTGKDSLDNEWTITTVGTTSFTQNPAYSQVGSAKKPATSITFTMKLPAEQTITALSAKFGGFNDTAGKVSMKVGDTEIGTGSLVPKEDVEVAATSQAKGTTITITVTDISKGVKCYSIAYSYSGSTGEVENAAKAPSLTASCEFEGDSHEVTITNNEQGATVYYTTDGSEPTTASESFTGESKTLTLTATTTVKAMAAIKGKDNSRTVTATYTFVTSIANTQETAYTVEEVKAIIDKSSETQLAKEKVYVKGTVSKVEKYNEKYKSITYWLDNDAFEVYSGKGLNGADFSAKEDVEVGATVIVYGNVKKYKDIYEFDYENYLVSYTAPTAEAPSSVAISGSPEKTEYTEGEAFDTKGLVLTATYSDESTRDVTSSATWTVAPATLTRDVTEVTVTATYMEKTDSKTFTIKVNVPLIANTQETAYTVEEVKAIIDKSSEELLAKEKVYVKGTVSKVEKYNEKYKSITYWLDNDAFEVYSGKGLNGADFSAKEDVEVGATVIVYGNVKKYKDIYEFDYENYLVSYTAPTAEAPSSVAISGSPEKTEYTEGEAFDTKGLVLTATYSDESTRDVTSSATWTVAPATLTRDVTEVTVTATYMEKTDSKTFTIKVNYTEPVEGNSIIVAEYEKDNVLGYAAMTTENSGGKFTSASIFKAGDKYITTGKLDDILFKTETTEGATTIQRPADGMYVQATGAKKVSYTASKYTWQNDGEKLTAADESCGVLRYNNGFPRFTTYTNNTGVYATIVDRSQVYEGGQLTLTGKEGDSYYATFYSDKAVEFVDATVYAVGVNADKALVLSEVAGKQVPANTAVLIKTAGETALYVYVESAPAIENNLLLGTLEDAETVAPQEGKDYLFYKLSLDSNGQNLGFYWGAENGAAFQNKGGHAYLAVEKTANAVKGFSITDLETGIHGVSVQGTAQGGALYDLQGRRVQKAVRGIYIQNGRKFFVK